MIQDCSDPLGMENGQISDEVITASSALRVNYEPWLARLHSQLGEGAWCAGVSKDINNSFNVKKVQMNLTLLTFLLKVSGFGHRLFLASLKRWLDDFSCVFTEKQRESISASRFTTLAPRKTCSNPRETPCTRMYCPGCLGH